MTVKEAYNFWSETYDSDENATRDLDKKVAQTLLANAVDLKVLEFGCGTGKNTEWLARQSRSVLAMDFSGGMLTKAKVNVTAANVHFIQHDITTRWPVKNELFDLIVGNLVLEHIKSLQAIFSEAYRVLQPAGKLFLCELHPYRQLKGTRAKFARDNSVREEKISAFNHDISEYINSAKQVGFTLYQIDEWRDSPSATLLELPRLVSFVFQK
jgi:malonyl-CoA O-methyltransferase